MKNFFVILMIVASSFIPFIAFAQANFVRDLFVGITGSDVFDLQKILNSDPETKITNSGVGSPGNETTYFGNLTKLAVQKFQLKYSDYVLKPVGLAIPTGYVGTLTRDFLNNNFGKNVSIENATSNESTTTTSQNIEKTNENSGSQTGTSFLVIRSFSEENIIPGQTFEINGSGFLKNSQVYLTGNKKDIKLDGVEFLSTNKIKATLPEKIEMGKYLVYIKNGDDLDTRWISPLFIIVTKSKIDSKTSKEIKDAFDSLKENNQKMIEKVNQIFGTVSVNKDNYKNFSSLISSIEKNVKGFFYNEAMAQIIQKTYWGGYIKKVHYCSCDYSFGIILTIKEVEKKGVVGAVTSAGGVNDLKVVYQPVISTLRAHYNIFKAGANTIGGWTTTEFTCQQTTLYVCIPDPSEPETITKLVDFLRGIGTSSGNSASYMGI